MVKRMPSDCWSDSKLVTDRLDAQRADDLERFVRSGGSALVALEPDDPHALALTGVDVTRRPSGHRVVRHPGRSLRSRSPRRRSRGDVGPRPLRVVSDDVVVAATTSHRFEHQPTITVRTVGAGRIVGTAIADLDAVRRHPTLGTFVARLLHPVTPSRSTDLGVGVVGYGPFGGMGYLHGLAATETDGLRLVAAADSAAERLVAARADFTELASHDSAEALAADPAVDIAIIATPPALHADLALQLLRAGKHVVIEKPMCLRRADADEIIATAIDLDRTVTVHQSRRWDRDWLAVRNVTGRGDIGEVFNIETFVGGFEHPCRAWHSEESISGGAIYDWGSHHVDWIIQLYGSAPSRVLCSAHTRVWHDTTNADQLSLWMQWPDGHEATFRQSDVWRSAARSSTSRAPEGPSRVTTDRCVPIPSSLAVDMWSRSPTMPRHRSS